MAAGNNIQGKVLKMVRNEGSFFRLKVCLKKQLFLCSFGSSTASSTGGGRPLKSYTGILLRPPLCTFQFQVWSPLVWMDGRPADPHAVSCDQAAVDAARPQSSLQSSFLFLGGQDCNDGLVEHRLQALLGQSGTFHIATCTNLIRRQKQKDSEKNWIRRWPRCSY